MAFEKYLTGKNAFILGLDDILYPSKDYLLQVYYLFAEFMAYTEQLDSGKMVDFMKHEFLTHGETSIFEKTAAQFSIPVKYATNFTLLHQNARLPLKLLLYQNVLSFLQEIVIERKEIFLLVDGDPLMQLNKIRQMEWHGLEKYLKVYFTTEYAPKPATASLDFMINQHRLNKSAILFLGNTLIDEAFAKDAGITYFSIEKL